MKTLKYIVEIDMPDGDYISPSWIKDDIEADLIEDEGRYEVRVTSDDGIVAASSRESLRQPPTIPSDLVQFRRDAAKDILCVVINGGVAAGVTEMTRDDIDIVVRGAIKIADELIKQLQDENEPQP